MNVHHEDTTRFLPDVVEAVSEQEQAGAEILALSTLTYHTDLREPKAHPVGQLGRWRRARSTGARTRDPASSFWVNTVGGPLQVCIAKKQYAKHWGKASERVAERTADAANRQAAAQRAARDEARREREWTFWEQQLRPALLSAIADKAKQQKSITRPLTVPELGAAVSTKSCVTV